MSFVVFSSILEQSLSQQVADEMWRVLKPGGLILFYDFAYSNPANPAVRGIARKQVVQLFGKAGAKFHFRRVTLAPPIARMVVRNTCWLAYTLEQLKFLNTHHMSIIRLDE
jgi:ubiquinone/menaquinone biosynthesis C-methylase UbiE